MPLLAPQWAVDELTPGNDHISTMQKEETLVVVALSAPLVVQAYLLTTCLPPFEEI